MCTCKDGCFSWGVNLSSPAHLLDIFIIYDPEAVGTGYNKCQAGGGWIDKCLFLFVYIVEQVPNKLSLDKVCTMKSTKN